MSKTTIMALYVVLHEARKTLPVIEDFNKVDEAIKYVRKAYAAKTDYPRHCALTKLRNALPDFSRETIANGLIGMVACTLDAYFKG